MNREVHVRICGGLEVRFLRSTRLCHEYNKLQVTYSGKQAQAQEPIFYPYLILLDSILKYEINRSKLFFNAPKG